MIKKFVDQNTMSDSNASFAGAFTIENRNTKDNHYKRTTGDVLKTTVREMREMSEVLRELTGLIVNQVNEKKSLLQALTDEREFRQNLDKAMNKSGTLSDLTPDLLIMKVAVLEDQFKRLEKLVSHKLMQFDSAL